jgi:uncharacterized damage-inducible protein DinB
MTSTSYFHHLYDLLHRSHPFYGSGLEESLERIPEADLHRSVGHRSIAQLLEHMLAWRRDLGKRLLDEPRERIELNSPQDWPPPDPTKTKADYLAELTETTEKIRRGLTAFDPARLNDKLHPDHDYTSVDLLEGGAHHDIYHLGQINLIAALLKNPTPQP